jgi:hypothetical protein
MRLVQTTAAILGLSPTLFAREPPAASVGTRGGQAQAAAVRSPEMLADGRVTFRLLAPNATEVMVQGNWAGGRDLKMTKDKSGLWSVTTAALPPELWAYTFSVDGVRTLDPRNYNVSRDGVGFLNTVLVPGDASAVFQARPVPHGTIKKLRLLFFSCGTEDSASSLSPKSTRTCARARSSSPSSATRASTSGRSGASRSPRWRRCCSDSRIVVA